MSDDKAIHVNSDTQAQPSLTPGAMLRQARLAKGMHISALASAIKVTQRKLELLESDQFDELHDATFVRALTKTICRVLKIDVEPILAVLPKPITYTLEHVATGINTPFRDHSVAHEPSEWRRYFRPVLIAPVFLVVAAAVIYFMPAKLSNGDEFTVRGAASATLGDKSASSIVATSSQASNVVISAVEPNASAAVNAVEAAPSAVGGTASGVVSSVVVQGGQSSASSIAPASASTPVPVVQQTAAISTPDMANATSAVALNPLVLRAKAPSWVEVVDGKGRPLLSRLLKGNETVTVDGAVPMKIKIGNAQNTELTFKGQPVDLAAVARDNVARLELK